MDEHDTVLIQTSPLLPYVELRRAQDSHACYRLHSHDECSLGVVDRGATRFCQGERCYRLTAGATVLINPDAMHSCNPEAGRWSYRMLFIDADQVARWQSEAGLSSGALRPFARACSHRRALYLEFDRLFGLLGGGAERLEAETRLLRLVLEAAPVAPVVRTVDRVRARRAHGLLMDRLTEAVTLEELSEAAGLSRYHLLRSFKACYGLPPHAYQIDQRIKRAKRRLRAQAPLLETALELGFADQAHFQRHFKSRMALTPRQYRAFFGRA